MVKNISTIKIHSTPEKVWAALTKPELVKQWQYGSDLFTDWKVGSEIRFKTEWEGSVFEQWGKVLEFKPYQLIRYTLFSPDSLLEDKPENYFVMDYVLTKEGDDVRLEIIHEDNRPGAVQEEATSESPVLKSLKEIIDRDLI